MGKKGTLPSYEEMLAVAMESLPKRSKDIERFRIPQVVSEAEGNKTVIRNFTEFLKVFRRDAKHFGKYLCKELATPGYQHGNFFVLQRIVQRNVLQKKIEDYVKEFVYCKECGEPDTRLVREGRVYFLVCEACGAKKPVRNL